MRPSSPNLRASAPRCADTAIVCPRDYHPRNSCHTSRRGTCPLATGASAGACGQGLSRSHGYRELPRGWSVSKISLPRQCPPARQAFRCLPASRPSCPSGIRSGGQPCHVRHPGPRSATPFGAAPFALWRPYPPGGLGKFRRTNMTAMPGKVACLYAICLSGASPPLLCVSTPESHTFSFLPCHDMTLRDGRYPSFRGLSHLCAGSAAAGPPAKVFGRVGHGEGEPFSQKVSLPATFSPKFSPASNLPASACRFAA